MEIRTEKRLEKLGERTGKRLLKKRGGRQSHAAVFGLVGELGAGKTTFMRGFARGLGIKKRVSSPTFVLARRYRIPAEGRKQSANRPLTGSGLRLRGSDSRRSRAASRDKSQIDETKVGYAKRFALCAMPYRWLWHFDCYRLGNEHDFSELGFHEIVQDPHAVVAVEWADRVRHALPKNTLWIFFRHHPKGRVITFSKAQSANRKS